MHWGMARIKHFWHSSKSKITPFTVSPNHSLSLASLSLLHCVYGHLHALTHRTVHLKRKMNITCTPIELATLSQQWLWTINAVPVYDISSFYWLSSPCRGEKERAVQWELKLMFKFITATMRRITTTTTNNTSYIFDDERRRRRRWWWSWW